MFRDSRGVVHTVSSPDPLADVPAGAAQALQEALLPPVPDADAGALLTTAEAVRDLLGHWQDAFFAALPDDVDLEEEERWAAEAGLSLVEVEEHDEEHEHVVEEPGGEPREDAADDLALLLDRTGLDDDPRAVLPERLVTALERELLLLPVRVRLEALIAADDLVQEWSELIADHEKLLGHVVLRHGRLTQKVEHDYQPLFALHARMHAAGGPGHGL